MITTSTSNGRTCIEIACSIGEFYGYSTVAENLPSFFSRGFTPDPDINYPKRTTGRAHFTFNKASDAMLFKLSLNV